MPSPDVHVTSAVLWRATLIGIVVDSIFVYLLIRHISNHKFKALAWQLVPTSGIFWSVLWLVLVHSKYWDLVYGYVFPGWARNVVPYAYGLLFVGIGYVLWLAAIRLPGKAVLNYCLLGGLVGTITHIWAIYRGILDKPPMLQGVSPLSATVFPFFEFIFYWCIILTLALVVHRARNRKTG